MDTNEKTGKSPAEELIVLGVASVETRGGPLAGEEIGGPNVPGISEE